MVASESVLAAFEAFRLKRRRRAAAGSAALAAGVFFALFLPFVSASCTETWMAPTFEYIEESGTVQTDELTGWELVAGKDANARVVDGQVQESTLQKVRDKVDQVAMVTRVLVVVMAIALVLAVVVAASGSSGWAASLLATGITSALVFAVFFLLANGLDVAAVEVHYKRGFFLSMMLTGAALAVDTWLIHDMSQPSRLLFAPIEASSGSEAGLAGQNEPVRGMMATISLVFVASVAGLMMLSGGLLLLAGASA